MNQEEKLVAYCGLYCGDCFGYKGKIANLAKELRQELRLAKFDKMAKGIPFKAFENYQECYDVLGALCCRKKNLEGCWECTEIESCKKLDSLKINHGQAHILNLRRIRKLGLDQFITGKKDWYVKAGE